MTSFHNTIGHEHTFSRLMKISFSCTVSKLKMDNEKIVGHRGVVGEGDEWGVMCEHEWVCECE